MATSYYNIGSALDDLGKPEEALFQYQKALEIRTRVFGHACSATSTGRGHVIRQDGLCVS